MHIIRWMIVYEINSNKVNKIYVRKQRLWVVEKMLKVLHTKLWFQNTFFPNNAAVKKPDEIRRILEFQEEFLSLILVLKNNVDRSWFISPLIQLIPKPNSKKTSIIDQGKKINHGNVQMNWSNRRYFQQHRIASLMDGKAGISWTSNSTLWRQTGIRYSYQ